ncbi:aminopeptidase P family protein [Pedobacter insulae]|uniref:Xaa-Pro aminopeptidase n=1 Tax=Pedobacter insulae TaxID=414048 RepID=A0A1I2T174_9SPHI|nr:aminopeptidase P family protein [Pedobacter insulae]SFG58540.1 Xaa-Pro aminopeptidase [Pedobacter insulae]
MFSKEEYINRRNSLKSNFNSGVLLFLGNDESPINFFDNTYHFRQDSSFLYYFGINAPKLAAIIDVDKDKIIVFGDEMSIDELVWMGRQQTLEDKAHQSGVTQVEPASKLSSYLKNVNHSEIHYLPPYRAENKMKIAAMLSLPIDSIKEHASHTLIKAVVAQRSIKSAMELVELDLASSTSADMHLLAMQMAKPGMKESEIAAALQQVAQKDGGNLAYPVILTVDGQILHNHYHGNILKEGDLVLNDSGAESSMGYAGDLTRTFPAGKKFSTKQNELYSLVLDSYQKAVKALRPGIKYLDIHYTACLTLAEGLKDLGLMKGNMQEAVLAGAHALFFQCGTGHMMGLDVHDMEDLGEQFVGYTDQQKKNTTQFGLKSLRLGKELETGYVLTVEPGLYFIPELIDQWQAANKFSDFIDYGKVADYRDFGGIRVEDDYVITQDSYRKLGKDLAISIKDIEAIRATAY